MQLNNKLLILKLFMDIHFKKNKNKSSLRQSKFVKFNLFSIILECINCKSYFTYLLLFAL